LLLHRQARRIDQTPVADPTRQAALREPLEATRYHSLVLENKSIPECLSVIACTEFKNDHEIMGLKHLKYDNHGVQFHPESILTTCGHDLLKNFLQSISMLY